MNEKVDRISALPEPLLHHILSFVPFEDVYQVRMLSRRWKQVWHTFPNLECRGWSDGYITCKKKLENLAEVLRNRSQEGISLARLTVEVTLYSTPEYMTLIELCLGYAILCNVKELDFHLYTCFLKSRLPQFVLSAKSIEVLNLQGFKLELPRSGVYLPSLKESSLVEVYADEHVIENLVARCPLIESLRIDGCEGFKSLKLFGHSELESENLWVSLDGTLERVGINGLNVESTDLSYGLQQEINVALCKNLKCLSLSWFSLMDEWLSNQISQLPFLDYLCLTSCEKLRAIKILGPSLRELIIIECRDLVEIKIEAPKLSIFKYQGDIISFSSNVLTLSEIVLQIDNHVFDAQKYAKFIELLAKFNHFSDVLDLRSNCESVIIPKELRHSLSPPLTGVKHLNFTIINHYIPSMAKVVDGLLWISPHLGTVVVNGSSYFEEFSFEFLYKRQPIYGGETPQCCQSFPVLCWQNCLKEVKIEATGICGDKIYLNCSSEDDGIFEKIDGAFEELNHIYESNIRSVSDEDYEDENENGDRDEDYENEDDEDEDDEDQDEDDAETEDEDDEDEDAFEELNYPYESNTSWVSDEDEDEGEDEDEDEDGDYEDEDDEAEDEDEDYEDEDDEAEDEDEDRDYEDEDDVDEYEAEDED